MDGRAHDCSLKALQLEQQRSLISVEKLASVSLGGERLRDATRDFFGLPLSRCIRDQYVCHGV
jgi:hypothetical protein